MYCYLKVNDQNEFEIVENLTPEEQKLVNEYLTKHQEVQELVTSTNSKLLEAISSDERLAVVYDAFQSGRIYKEDQSVIDQQVSLIPDTTEATESTAESSGETAESTVVVDPSTASDTETASTETASEQTTISPEATLAVESSSVG
jgi:MinD-like ATPase involved in chromosome partitioning or flagellar assembly